MSASFTVPDDSTGARLDVFITSVLGGHSRSNIQRLIKDGRVLVDGKSAKQIAAQLGLSANTVAVHRANIMNALGIHKTAELVVYAIRKGLVNLP